MIINIKDLEQFKRLVSKVQKPKLIYIHVDWCRHCRNLTPLIETLLSHSNYKNIDILSLKANSSEKIKRFVLDKLSISKFPSFMKYEDGKFYEIVLPNKDVESLRDMLDNKF